MQLSTGTRIIDYVAGTAVTAEAAVRVLRERRLSDRVKVISYYFGPGVYRGIQRRTIVAAPTDQPALQTRLAVDLVVRILEKKTYPKRVSAPVLLIDGDSSQPVRRDLQPGPSRVPAHLQHDEPGRDMVPSHAHPDGAPERPRRWYRWLLVLAVAAGIGASLAVSHTLYRTAERQWITRSETEAQRLSTVLLGWMDESYAPLSGLAALVESSHRAKPEEFPECLGWHGITSHRGASRRGGHAGTRFPWSMGPGHLLGELRVPGERSGGRLRQHPAADGLCPGTAQSVRARPPSVRRMGSPCRRSCSR